VSRIDLGEHRLRGAIDLWEFGELRESIECLVCVREEALLILERIRTQGQGLLKNLVGRDPLSKIATS
jgi:hypothetical protein